MKKFFKIALLVLLGLAVIWTFWFLWKKSRPEVKKYDVENVTMGNIEKRTVATGKVDPRNEILIKPQMSGIIAEVYKEAGDVVKAGVGSRHELDLDGGGFGHGVILEEGAMPRICAQPKDLRLIVKQWGNEWLRRRTSSKSCRSSRARGSG